VYRLESIQCGGYEDRGVTGCFSGLNSGRGPSGQTSLCNQLEQLQGQSGYRDQVSARIEPMVFEKEHLGD
jgi:hypothetical protein